MENSINDWFLIDYFDEYHALLGIRDASIYRCKLRSLVTTLVNSVMEHGNPDRDFQDYVYASGEWDTQDVCIRPYANGTFISYCMMLSL